MPYARQFETRQGEELLSNWVRYSQVAGSDLPWIFEALAADVLIDAQISNKSPPHRPATVEYDGSQDTTAVVPADQPIESRRSRKRRAPDLKAGIGFGISSDCGLRLAQGFP